jgi:malonyl CoA-acyl carrier protein transacylase
MLKAAQLATDEVEELLTKLRDCLRAQYVTLPVVQVHVTGHSQGAFMAEVVAAKLAKWVRDQVRC